MIVANLAVNSLSASYGTVHFVHFGFEHSEHDYFEVI